MEDLGRDCWTRPKQVCQGLPVDIMIIMIIIIIVMMITYSQYIIGPYPQLSPVRIFPPYFRNKFIYFTIGFLPYHVRSVSPMLCPLFMFYRSRFCVHFSRPLARRCVIRSPYTGLFVSPSGIFELDCATTKTDTAERSISIGRESLQVFFGTRGLGVIPGSTARG